VAHDENRGFASDWLNLLKRCENEHGSLTETGLGLADDIGSENRLRNNLFLDCIRSMSVRECGSNSRGEEVRPPVRPSQHEGFESNELQIPEPRAQVSTAVA
jgi:hypothetical protein